MTDTRPRRYQARPFDAARRRHCPADARYVGRPCWGWKGSPWANPYRVQEHGRDAALALFASYAVDRAAREPDWLAPLRGKDICCWCKILSNGVYIPCHGDILLCLANGISMKEVQNENTRLESCEALY